jgi:transcription-repair coupling factor (superfamily II helicase)
MSYRKGAGLLASLDSILAGRSQGGITHLEGLTGPAKAAAIVELYRHTHKPQLIICPEEEDARRLVRDLKFFMGEADEPPDFHGEQRIRLLAPERLSPYESKKFLPSRTRQMDLLGGLFCLTQPFRPAITVTTAWGLTRRYIPKKLLTQQTEYLLAGADIERDAVLRKLTENGYTQSPIVEDPGSFSARGGIIDAFSPLYNWPIRMEFFGDTLESVRLFNPNSQKSMAQLEEAYLLPVREVILNKDMRARGRSAIFDAATDQEAMDRRLQTLLIDLEEGLYSPELDGYLPLFFEEMAPLFAYLSSDTQLVLDEPGEIFGLVDHALSSLELEYSERLNDGDLTLPPLSYVQPKEDIESRLVHQPQLCLHKVFVGEGGQRPEGRFSWDSHDELKQELLNRRGHIEVLQPLVRRLKYWLNEGFSIFLVAHTRQQLSRLLELLEPHDIHHLIWDSSFPETWRATRDLSAPRINGVIGPMVEGQVWNAEKVVFLCEEEIFGERRRRPKQKAVIDKAMFLTSLDEISEGDFIVHVEFGIGVYRGLVTLEAGQDVNDFLLIEYTGNDKLYLPVTRLDKVQKYSGADGAIPQLDRLGGTRWAKLKGKVKEAIREMAEELLKLYATRNVAKGFSFSEPDAYFREFEATFPYEETPDQENAIRATLKDMHKSRPMDRLICGDVGFGKTEVALRAAFKAVLDHKQVAVLVPTTVLAMQHTETFSERLKNYPAIVEGVSRFQSPKEQRDTLAKVKAGKVDILIGTHRLLSKDVQFKDLGLLIVDEEQRFGVAHKEKLKKFRENVDVLTLTATPIPRTLNMALSGVRDISIIRTPPMDRLSIRTYVSRFDEEIITEAINTELSRGGQVYFVHNRVGSIDAMASLIKRLVPAARVSVAHGQMSEGQLEKVMLEFVKRETNVLVTTTIIESGIDIPSVNTMVVNRADTFGLSQLYQLRGRVGRGRERAYAYLLVPSPSSLTKDAQKRLAALMRFTELGSGFRIASHDMEIRGAGNLLGKQQSGHIAAIGIDLYFELIEEAVRELKGETVTHEVDPQINVFEPAYLPRDYIGDPALRLNFYKRLSGVRSESALDELITEMEDRFGRMPERARSLMKVIELKILLRRLNAAGLDLTPARVSVNLGEHCVLDPSVVLKLVARRTAPFQVTPDMKLVRPLLAHEMEDPIKASKNILQEILEYGTADHSTGN